MIGAGEGLCWHFVLLHTEVVLPVFGHDYVLTSLFLVLVLDVLNGLGLLGYLLVHVQFDML